MEKSTETKTGGGGKESYVCPHCGQNLKKWRVPDSPFSSWDTDFLYVCFNDKCPYFVQGWQVLSRQGVSGYSYRHAYDPVRDSSMPLMVTGPFMLKDGIVEEGEQSD